MGVTGTEAPPDGQYDNLRAKTKQVERETSYSHMVAQGRTGVKYSTSQCELRSTFPNVRVTNVIRIVTYYTLPQLESPDSSWMTRSQRSRRRDKGLCGRSGERTAGRCVWCTPFSPSTGGQVGDNATDDFHLCLICTVESAT